VTLRYSARLPQTSPCLTASAVTRSGAERTDSTERGRQLKPTDANLQAAVTQAQAAAGSELADGTPTAALRERIGVVGVRPPFAPPDANAARACPLMTRRVGTVAGFGDAEARGDAAVATGSTEEAVKWYSQAMGVFADERADEAVAAVCMKRAACWRCVCMRACASLRRGERWVLTDGTLGAFASSPVPDISQTTGISYTSGACWVNTCVQCWHCALRAPAFVSCSGSSPAYVCDGHVGGVQGAKRRAGGSGGLRRGSGAGSGRCHAVRHARGGVRAAGEVRRGTSGRQPRRGAHALRQGEVPSAANSHCVARSTKALGECGAERRRLELTVFRTHSSRACQPQRLVDMILHEQHHGRFVRRGSR
jgi:hypothetical protein